VAVPTPFGSTRIPSAQSNPNRGGVFVAVVTMRELLEAGVHFGHQTRRWNPKMRRYIFTERGGIYIIDLQQTSGLLEEAYSFVRNIAERNGTVLFVGTKKQAQDSIEDEAKRVGMPYVNHRWLGGLLTNWRTISERLERLHELRRLRDEGQLELLPPKERITMMGELEKLETNLGGVMDMKRLPDAMFVVDLKKEQLAIREARRLGVPVVALVDTNCDPDDADYVIPGNDDAIRSCSLIVRAIADGIAAGAGRVTEAEMARANGRGREEVRAPTPSPAAEAAEDLGAIPVASPPTRETVVEPGEASAVPPAAQADPVAVEAATTEAAPEPEPGPETPEPAVAEVAPEPVVVPDVPPTATAEAGEPAAVSEEAPEPEGVEPAPENVQEGGRDQ
jgi:small subunit ribosomal protein S2